jgi:hypothetical protein
MAIDQDKLKRPARPGSSPTSVPDAACNGIDYPREGLTLERMGLARKTPVQIRAHVGAPTADLAGAPATKS